MQDKITGISIKILYTIGAQPFLFYLNGYFIKKTIVPPLLQKSSLFSRGVLLQVLNFNIKLIFNEGCYYKASPPTRRRVVPLARKHICIVLTDGRGSGGK
jgi:hypothetical protein